MRKLEVSDITNTVAMPIKGGTLLHLQLAYQEALTALGNNIIGRSADFTNAYILYGLINSGTSGSMNVSAGAILYGGEVFLVDAFTLTVADTAVGNIVTTSYTTDADPVTFTDGVARNVHEIRKIVFTDGASGSGLFDFNNMLNTPLVLKNENIATLGATYTVKFDQDRSVFFAAASLDTTISFDLTNAVPGAVVRLKWTYGAGRTLTISTGAGQTVIKDSGDLGSVANNTNLLYATYVGINSLGNAEISYIIKQV